NELQPLLHVPQVLDLLVWERRAYLKPFRALSDPCRLTGALDSSGTRAGVITGTGTTAMVAGPVSCPTAAPGPARSARIGCPTVVRDPARSCLTVPAVREASTAVRVEVATAATDR